MDSSASTVGDGRDAPDKELTLVPGAVEDAERFLANHPDTRGRFERVAMLVEGFESPFGLELLSTVHWTAKHGRAPTGEGLVASVYAWGERKRQYSPKQIGLALDVLTSEGWLSPERTVASP